MLKMTIFENLVSFSTFCPFFQGFRAILTNEKIYYHFLIFSSHKYITLRAGPKAQLQFIILMAGPKGQSLFITLMYGLKGQP